MKAIITLESKNHKKLKNVVQWIMDAFEDWKESHDVPENISMDYILQKEKRRGS